MMERALWTLAGLLLGAITHLATVMVLPRLATRDPYARMAPLTPENEFRALTSAEADASGAAYADPAFALALCRYDLSRGPVKISVRLSPWYTALSFYNRRGVAFYAINDRAGAQESIELDLATAAQRARLTQDDDATGADRLVVISPTATGLVLLKAFAPEPGQLPLARGAITQASCSAQP